MANLLDVALSLCTPSRICLGNWLLVLKKMQLLAFRKMARIIREQMHRGQLRVAEVVAVDEDGCPRKIRILKVLPRRAVQEL